MHNNHHVFNEIYVPQENKWIWIDPLFAIMAEDDNGEYLSLLETRNLLFEGKKITFTFFGNNSHQFYSKKPSQHEYFDSKEDFSNIMVTWGNNVFSENNFNNRYNFLPKSIRQFVGMITGKMPQYLVFVDKYSENQME